MQYCKIVIYMYYTVIQVNLAFAVKELLNFFYIDSALHPSLRVQIQEFGRLYCQIKPCENNPINNLKDNYRFIKSKRRRI